jgi:hypothetical protein
MSGKNNTPQASRNGTPKLTVTAIATAKKLPLEFLRDTVGLRDGVEIPYFDPAGNEVVVKRRTALKAKEGSYWPKGVELLAYGAERLEGARRARFLILPEGESDCWALWFHGLPALGIPGANAAKVLATEHLEEIDKVYVHREPDRGGQQHIEGVKARLRALGFRGKAFELRLADGIKDLADLHCADPVGFLERIKAAIEAATPISLHQAGDGLMGITSHKREYGDLPSIVITTAENIVNDEAVAALARDSTLFQRGGMLVRLVTDDATGPKGISWSSGPRIEPLPRELLRERLAAAANWIINKGDTVVQARPPGWCIGAVFVRGQYPGIRQLYAVVNHPALRFDGTILTTPGYDASTGLYLVASDKPVSIGDSCTLQDASRAAATILQIVADFPFASEAHKAAWLAGLLTPLARFGFQGPAPLFLVDANTRGSGKGLLNDCISEIVSGRRFTVATYTKDEDELRKRITSLALAGDRLVLLDNLEGQFGNATLDAALTATSWNDRLLSTNRTVSAPLLMTWFATGNNVAVHADTARRICHVRLESPLERPEERSDFRYPKLLRYVQDHRHDLLTAALTILRAYCIAGKPRQSFSAWGSFQDWSDLVRSAVVWVGLPDPAATRMELQNRADVSAEYMTVIISCLEQLDPDRRGLTASEIIDRIKQHTGPKATEPPPTHLADLKDAIEAMAGRLDPKVLGYKLRSYRRRNFGGKYLDVASTAHRAARWAVFPAASFAVRRDHPHHVHRPHFVETGEDDEHGEDNPAGEKSVGADRGDAWEPEEDRSHP